MKHSITTLVTTFKIDSYYIKGNEDGTMIESKTTEKKDQRDPPLLSRLS